MTSKESVLCEAGERSPTLLQISVVSFVFGWFSMIVGVGAAPAGADFRAPGHVGDPFRQHRAVAEVVAVGFPRRVARFQVTVALAPNRMLLGDVTDEAEVRFAFGPGGDGRQQGEQREQAGPGKPETEQWRST